MTTTIATVESGQSGSAAASGTVRGRATTRPSDRWIGVPAARRCDTIGPVRHRLVRMGGSVSEPASGGRSVRIGGRRIGRWHALTAIGLALALVGLTLTWWVAGLGTADVLAGPVPVRHSDSPTSSPAASTLISPSPSGHPTPTSTRPTSAGGATSTGGKPGPTNTGVPAGTQLRMVTGDQVYRTANQVISGLDIHGYVTIRATNVTIRNSVIRGGSPTCSTAVIVIVDGASATIQDSEIAPSHPNACLDGIAAQHVTLRRLNIHGTVDGIKAFDRVTLVDSYVHDLSWFASDPNQGGGPTHNDAVQTYGGNQHIVLRHNTLVVGRTMNSAYQVTQDEGQAATDLRIEDNWLDGGGCTLNFADKGGPTPMTGIYVVDNRFGRNSYYNCPILLSTQTFLSQFSGNVWADTGTPIPPPQRHD
jgi:hypothetical protein